MATGSNDKEVKVGFVTEANTKGVDKLIDKIEETTDATKDATKATKDLTAAEKDRAERKAAYEQRLADSRANGTNVSQPASDLNPMTDGSMLAAEERLASARQKVADATREEAAATAELERSAAEALRKQQDADVERAKGMRDLRQAAEEAEPKIDKVVGLQRAQLALQVAEAIGRMAINVRALGEDLKAADVKGAGVVTGLATGMEAVSSAVSGAATGFAVGGPLGAGIGAIAGLLSGPLKTAVGDTIGQFKALKTAEDDAATAAKNLKTAQQAASLEGTRNFLVEYFQRGRDAIIEATKEIERNRRVLDATAAADTSGRETAQKEAIRGGANPNAVNTTDIRGDFQDKIDALNAKVANAQAIADQAEKTASLAESQLGLREASGAADEAELAKLRVDFETARKAAVDARAEAITTAQVALQDTRTLQDELKEREAATVKSFQDQEIAKSNEIVGIVESSKQKLSDTQKQALERTKEAIADGELSAQEQAQLSNDLRTILGGFRSTIDENVKVGKLFTEVVTLQNTNVTDLKNVVSGLKAQVEDLRVQIKTITTPQSLR